MSRQRVSGAGVSARTGGSTSPPLDRPPRRARYPAKGISDEIDGEVLALRLICGGGVTLTVTEPAVIAWMLVAERERRQRERGATR